MDAIGLTRIDASYLSALERLADLTGGRYERASRSEDLERIFREGIERLQSTPVASFTAASLRGDGQEHRVGVRVDAEGRLMTAETKLVLTRRDQPALQASPSQTPNPAPGFLYRLPKWVWAAAPAALLGLILLTVFLLRRGSSSRKEPAQPFSSLNLNETGGTIDGGGSSPAPSYDIPPQRAPEPAPAEEEDFVASANEGFGATMVDPNPQPQSRPARRHTRVRTEFAPPAPGRPAALLMAQEGLKSGAAFAIEESPFWIGTEEANQLCVAGDTFLSGYHACIEYREGTLLLYDNGSTNGTFLNGERVSESPRPLGYGDQIKAGRSLFVLTRA